MRIGEDEVNDVPEIKPPEKDPADTPTEQVQRERWPWMPKDFPGGVCKVTQYRSPEDGVIDLFERIDGKGVWYIGKARMTGKPPGPGEVMVIDYTFAIEGVQSIEEAFNVMADYNAKKIVPHVKRLMAKQYMLEAEKQRQMQRQQLLTDRLGLPLNRPQAPQGIVQP